MPVKLRLVLRDKLFVSALFTLFTFHLYTLFLLQMRENIVSLHDKIPTQEEAVKYLQEHEVVKKETECAKCGVKVTKTCTRNGYVYFRCRGCGFEESVRKGTFLYAKVTPH